MEPQYEKVAHLKMLQDVISRLASNSFAMKNFATASLAAMATVSYSVKQPWVLGVAIVTSLVFASLDAYYLYLERRFRDLYDLVRKDTGAIFENDPYSMDFNLAPKRKTLIDAYLSHAVWPFYLALVIGIVVLLALGLALLDLGHNLGCFHMH